MSRMLLLSLLLSTAAQAQAIDGVDAALRERAYLQAWSAPLGQAISWRNPSTDRSGKITPLREYKSPTADAICRDMMETLSLAGEMRRGTATGCRGADRVWRVVTATPGEPPVVPADLPPYQPPADASADPARPGQSPRPGIVIGVRPRGRASSGATSVPDMEILLPPPPGAPSPD